MTDGSPLVRVEDLRVYYPVKRRLFKRPDPQRRWVRAVDGVSFEIKRGETLALVGESGCGKTTVGSAVIGLNAATGGRILFDGEDVTRLSFNEFRPLRKRMQFVFQDPYSSLNPRMTVRQTLTRSMAIHRICPSDEMNERAAELMRLVGLSREQLNRYPHEFSGGQRQRISIARALAVNPELIIADEPTAALDVSIQSQILNLLLELKARLGLTMLFISHDLSVVNYISDRTAIMYLGHIVELGPSREVLQRPMHPYTQALIEAVPRRTHRSAERKVRLSGSIPSPITPPSGCPLHPRCPFAAAMCGETAPDLLPAGGRMLACHLCKDEQNGYKQSERSSGGI